MALSKTQIANALEEFLEDFGMGDSSIFEEATSLNCHMWITYHFNQTKRGILGCLHLCFQVLMVLGLT